MAGDVKVAVVTGTLSTSGTGTTDFTESGFGTPKACIIEMTFDAVDDANVAAESRASIGFSDFTDDYCLSHQDEDASAAVDCDTRKSNNTSYCLLDVAGAVDIDGTAGTVTDGVRLTNATNASGTAVQVKVTMFGGADLQVSLDSIDMPNSIDATVVVTTNIDQDMVFFIGSRFAGENSSSSGIENGFGVAHIDTSDHATFANKSVAYASDHAAGSGDPTVIMRSDRCLKTLQEGGGERFGVEVTAATTTSYTITERDVAAESSREIYALALDLDDRKSKVGSVDSPTSGATWTPSVSLGFKPQYVGLGLTLMTAEDTKVADATAGSLGISSNTGGSEEACISWYNEDAAGTTNTNSLFRSRVIDLRDDDVTTVLQDHSHSSFDSGGWTYTINTINDGTVRKWFYWAVEEEPAAGAATPKGPFGHPLHGPLGGPI